MYEWSDLRIFLAVVNAGSALGAAKSLGVNQTTVNRRIQALEHDLGLTLFDRKNRGHALTEQGTALLSSAEKVADTANNLEFAAERLRNNIAGVVRITAPEETSVGVIIPIAAAFRKLHPEVRIEQVVADQKLDIVHGEADIAIRLGSHPDDPRLIARRLPSFAWALYAGDTYISEHGCPANLEQVADHDFIGYAGGPRHWKGYVWFVEQAQPRSHVSRSNNVNNMKAVLKSGLGIGLLPCFLGDEEPGLVRCFDPSEETNADSWLVTSPEALNSPQVRAFIDFLVPRIVAQKNRFLGKL